MRSKRLLLIGWILVAGCDSSTGSETRATVRPGLVVAPPTEPIGTVPAPDVSTDPLGLLDSGWSRSRRETYDRFVVDDAYLCTERIEWQAKRFLPLVSEGYRVPGASGAWIDVAFIDYGDATTAATRLGSLADPVAACVDDSIVAARIESTNPEVGQGFEAYGYVDNDSRSWVVTNNEGLAVLFEGAHITPDIEHTLTERAVRFLQ